MKKRFVWIFCGMLAMGACTSSTKDESKKYFEGTITYKNGYQIKSDKLDSARLAQFFGKSVTLYFKEGNYFDNYDGGYMLEDWYDRKSNRSFAKLDSTDTLHWTDCGKPPLQKMNRFEINPKRKIILGINCDELITYYDDKIVTYYYNPDSLKIDPDWYKDYTLYYKNFNVQKMKSMYLEYKIERPDFIATVTATAITRRSIDDNVFDLPKNKILVESK